MSSLSFEPMSALMGVRAHGIDLRQPITSGDAQALRDSFARAHVLCVPNQDISNDDQIRFAQVFGQANTLFIGAPRKADEPSEDGPEKRGIIYISNVRENGQAIGALPDGELHFHSDGAHRKSPYRATTLYAIAIPSHGGETRFSDLQAAFDALTPAMQARIETLRVRNVYDTRATLRTQTNEYDDNLSTAEHPLVRVHPDTGRKSLYLSQLMTRNIVGLERAASEDLLAQLFEVIERPEFIYDHKWSLGDLLIWDNRCLNHARSDFPSDQKRHMRRVTVSEPDFTPA
jgi:taurine dioxygenase